MHIDGVVEGARFRPNEKRRPYDRRRIPDSAELRKVLWSHVPIEDALINDASSASRESA